MNAPQDQFTEWRALLKGENVAFNQDDPISGYFRTRLFKDGPLEPVAIWRDDDGLNIYCDGKPAELSKVWPWAARNPVTYAAYEGRIKTGQWPDIDTTVHLQNREAIGGNRPPEDPAVILQEQIEAAAAGASAYAEIGDDTMAAKAQTLRSRLLELSGQADKHRDALKRPHLEAGRAIDDKWQPIIKGAKLVADKIRNALSRWETAKLAKEREAQRAAEAKARKALLEATDIALAVAAVSQPPAPSAPTPNIKGAAGRAAAVKLVRVVTEITDQDALYGALRERVELKELLLKLAQRSVDAGIEIPGIKIEEQRRVA